jgi:carbamoyltransferase
MIRWGITALNHGSSLAVFQGTELVKFETCSGDQLDRTIIRDSLTWGGPCEVYWYERPLLKKLRQLTAGQWSEAFDQSVIPRRYINDNNLKYAKLKYTPHHASHAAAGYYTSPFDHCAIVVLDAIGEFECASVWEGKNGQLKKVWGRDYPHSLGLFYSAFTKLIGYQPILEEHLLQKDSELGDPYRYYEKVRSYISGDLILTYNFHRGVRDWKDPIVSDQDRWDIAAAVQRVFEEQVSLIMVTARSVIGTDNLVYMGGCAMNSLANRRVVEPFFNYRWSLPNPGDASSAVGAVLYHTKQRIKWKHGVAKHLQINV